jgi:hypothetical protein
LTDTLEPDPHAPPSRALFDKIQGAERLDRTALEGDNEIGIQPLELGIGMGLEPLTKPQDQLVNIVRYGLRCSQSGLSSLDLVPDLLPLRIPLECLRKGYSYHRWRTPVARI